MINTHEKGKSSEKIACDYLKTRDYSLIKQNWRSGKYGEIDIIANDNKTRELVFIEVKSRQTSLDEAKELVTKTKQQKLYKLANYYLYQNKLENKACRFDVIAIRMNRANTVLEHIKNAF